MSWWISAIAPTSTPRVGSSKMISFGFCTSALATTTFCWLPPESSMTRASALIALMFSAAIHCFAMARISLMLTVADLRPPAGHGCQIDVLGDRHGFEEAFDLAVLGDVDDAVANGRTRHAVAHGPSVEPHLPAVEEVALQHAGYDLRRLGASRADQAEDAVICPAKTEKDVLRTTLPIERFCTLSTFSPAWRGPSGPCANRRVRRSACGPPWRARSSPGRTPP